MGKDKNREQVMWSSSKEHDKNTMMNMTRVRQGTQRKYKQVTLLLVEHEAEPREPYILFVCLSGAKGSQQRRLAIFSPFQTTCLEQIAKLYVARLADSDPLHLLLPVLS